MIIINNGQIVADDSIAHLQEVNTSQNILMVSFERPIDGAMLRELKGIRSSAQVNDNTWKLDASNADELRRELMQWALNHNMNITSMQSEVHTREDVFRALTK